MQQFGEETLFSASDLVNFLECEHHTALDLIDLKTPLPRAADDAEALLFQAKGLAHEARFVEALKARHGTFVDIAQSGGLEERVVATRRAMHEGVEVIYQATLRDGPFIGHADFLRRVAMPSGLGPHSYEAIDTKLSRSTKAKFIIQLAFYSSLLAKTQSRAPDLMHVVLGDQTERAFRYADYARYFSALVRALCRARAAVTGRDLPGPL